MLDRHLCSKSLNYLSQSVKMTLILVVLTDNVSSTNGITSNEFTRLTTPGVAIATVSTFQTPSVLSCSARCVSIDQGSYFGYDNTARQCSCGSSLVAGSVEASLKLYRHEDAAAELTTTTTTTTTTTPLQAACPSSKCDSVSGFSCHLLAATAVCIKQSSTSKSYADAEAECQVNTDGRLFISDTAEKMDLMEHIYSDGVIASNDFVWVGVDDRSNEDTWVWADGRAMTTDERSALFKPTQPNNINGQDCGALKKSSASANVLLEDQDCNNNSYYHICEIPLE